nr:ABC transporter ATP-binding protein [uncultured Fusobacterium sp.]
MENKNRSAINIMFNLIKLLDSLWKVMSIAVSTGVIGFIFSFCITLFGAYAFLSIIPATKDNLKFVFGGGYSTQTYFYAMMFCGFFRAILHYLEQFANHYIAFHLLAEIRVKLFKVMRRLAPAKMENKNQGNLISMLTTDIELLEVFYAHTISPVIIAIFTSVFLFIYFFKLNFIYALYMLFAQLVIGVIVPYIAHKRSAKAGIEARQKLGNLNDEFLDKLKGIREVIQYLNGKNTLKKIDKITLSLGKNQKDLRNKSAEVQMMVDSAIIILSTAQLLLSCILVANDIVNVEATILAGVLQVGSFAPYINIAALGNILAQTFACGERVLDLLAETPAVDENEISVDNKTYDDDIVINNISYSYPNIDKNILKDFSLKIKKGQPTGIMGQSGCGKSTLLKLIMRFWNVKSGEIAIDNKNIKSVPLKNFQQKFSYMTQSTSLFIGNIRDNLLVAKIDATDEEIYTALKKASFYDYVMSLPDKLDSIVEEGGKNFSGGERQRIGLARVFLANREFFMLDEPTSNLDILNEAIILKSLADEAKDKTVILVSHRESTLSICDEVFKL